MGKPDGRGLENFIVLNGIDAEIVVKGASEETLKAHELLCGLGLAVRPEQMIKALVCIPLDCDQYMANKAILAMVSGPDRLDLEKLARALGHERVVLADQVTAEKLSGYPRGGTPPIGHAKRLRIVMDSVLAKQDVLFGGGGDVAKILKIPPKEIRRAATAAGEEFLEADIAAQ